MISTPPTPTPTPTLVETPSIPTTTSEIVISKLMPERDSGPVIVSLVSGSIAGTTATIAKQPLERLKWLRQVARAQSALNRDTNYYRITKRILQKEGMFGPFRGVYAGITRNVPHAALIYTAFPRVRGHLIQHNPSLENQASLLNTMTGSIASVLCTIITHPLDTVRVRYAVQFEHIRHPSYSSLLGDIYHLEGPIAFYRGIMTTCFGAIFRGGVGFGIYETIKSDSLRDWKSQRPILDRLSIGMLAGIASTAAAYPIDTVRRRMQVWGSVANLNEVELRVYGENVAREISQSGIKLMRHIVEHDGIIGLYRGLGITMIKTPIATAVSLTINDLVKKYFGVNY